MTNDPVNENDAVNDPADDPRLTAYALGELPDADRAAVEALLARDEAARRFVEETRAFAASLGGDLAAAPAAVLTETQRAAVLERARTSTPQTPAKARVFRVAHWAVPAGLAAAILVGVAVANRERFAGGWTAEREVGALRYQRSDESRPRPAAAVAEVDDDYDGDGNLVRETRPPADAPVRVDAAPEPVGGHRRILPVEATVETKGAGPQPGSEPGRTSLVMQPVAAPKPPAKAADFVGGIVAGGGGAPVAGPAPVRIPGLRGPGGGGGGDGQGKAPPPGTLPVDEVAFLADAREVAERLRYGERDRLERRLDAPGSESYAAFADNPFRRAADAPLSTFGIDVDKASYANVRRFLNAGTLPPPDAVRIEELLNYFPYRYAPPTDGSPFAAHVEIAGCPWETSHRLVRVALKGRVEDMQERRPANLVFLIDVSGSMQSDDKLPLLVRSMKQLVPALGARDRVSIVTYAGAAGVALPPTAGDRHDVILAALDQLRAGGSTNGAAGIETAYRLAQETFIEGGANRVLLATDGDFNVGVSDDGALVRIIEEKAKSNVFLSVLGFGTGNLKDAKMEGLADRGNGNYAYVDSLREGRKVLVQEAAGTLLTIAKDVKLQIEFNPLRVEAYRLIGYENRALAAADFANDAKDAGDLGAGHAVTALYEVVPAPDADAAGQALRYQKQAEATREAHSGEMLVVKLRFKEPEGARSAYREIPVTDSGASYARASADFKFAAAVAEFGMLLRGSPHRGQSSFDAAMELATEGLDYDPDGWRAEFVDLVRKAKTLSGAR